MTNYWCSVGLWSRCYGSQCIRSEKSSKIGVYVETFNIHLYIFTYAEFLKRCINKHFTVSIFTFLLLPSAFLIWLFFCLFTITILPFYSPFLLFYVYRFFLITFTTFTFLLLPFYSYRFYLFTFTVFDILLLPFYLFTITLFHFTFFFFTCLLLPFLPF